MWLGFHLFPWSISKTTTSVIFFICHYHVKHRYMIHFLWFHISGNECGVGLWNWSNCFNWIQDLHEHHVFKYREAKATGLLWERSSAYILCADCCHARSSHCHSFNLLFYILWFESKHSFWNLSCMCTYTSDASTHSKYKSCERSTCYG